MRTHKIRTESPRRRRARILDRIAFCMIAIVFSAFVATSFTLLLADGGRSVYVQTK